MALKNMVQSEKQRKTSFKKNLFSFFGYLYMDGERFLLLL